MNTPNRMEEAAISYAGKAWCVLPVHSCKDGACSCGKKTCSKAGKHPRVNRWQTIATMNEKIIRHWWHAWPDANVAILTGAVSDLVVIDLDNNGKAGEANFRALAEQHGGVPSTMTVRTGNGLHLYFRHPGVPIKNSVCKLAEGVDVKADGGYVVAPPSMHASGTRYEIQDGCDVLVLPQWLEERIGSSVAAGKEGNQEVIELLDGPKDVPEGQRNNTMATFVFGLRVGKGMAENEILRSALAINQFEFKPPLPEVEIREMVSRTCEKHPAQNVGKSQRRQESMPLYWFKLNTRELTGDAFLASLADYQLGWYIRLKTFAWSNGGFLVDDEDILRRLAQADSPDKFRAEYRRVLREFEPFENGQGEKLLVNRQLAEEHLQVLSKWEQKVAAGKRRHQ